MASPTLWPRLASVVGLDYQDPRLDPHHVFQSFKEHGLARALLEGGKMVRYGAKTLPYGGWLTMPKLAGKGWMILGDSASMLNSQRLKGIHLADQERDAGGGNCLRIDAGGGQLEQQLWSRTRAASRAAGSRRSYTRYATFIRASSRDCCRAWCGAAYSRCWAAETLAPTPPTTPATAICASLAPSADRLMAAKQPLGRRRATAN